MSYRTQIKCNGCLNELTMHYEKRKKKQENPIKEATLAIIFPSTETESLNEIKFWKKTSSVRLYTGHT